MNACCIVLTDKEAFRNEVLRDFIPSQLERYYDYVVLVPCTTEEALILSMDFLSLMPCFEEKDYCGTVLIEDKLHRVFVVG